MSTDVLHGLDFGATMRDVTKGLLVKPVLHNYLYDAAFPDFDVKFRNHAMEREPDGWFHPSTHPLWKPGALLRYLTRPSEMPVEKKRYMNTLSITFGTAFHGFVEVCLEDAGIRPKALNVCTVCPRECPAPKGRGKIKACGCSFDEGPLNPDGTHKVGCTEPGVVDAETGSRGHMDGLLDLSRLSVPNAVYENPVFEFKCLAPETPVSMADGSLVEAQKISAGDSIVAWDEESERLTPRTVRAVWDNGVVPVWSVSTKAGRQIGVTEEHPFLTSRGWVFARDLVVGDKVRVAFGHEWFRDSASTAGRDDEAYLLGVLVGDGGLTGCTPTIHSVDPGVLAEVDRIASGMGCRMVQVDDVSWRISRSATSGPNPLTDTLRREGLFGCTSRTKFTPRSVWTSGPQGWADFLSGYFDADGTVVTKGSYPHLSWASVNKALLVECQTMLAYLGIRASIGAVRQQYRGRDHVSWRLLVRDRRAVLKAQSVLRPASPVKASLLADIDIPERPDGRWVRQTQQGWDEVEAVTEGLARPTIAVEVEGGTHVTAGLVTHNTSSARKGILDLDLDEYRRRFPEYYAQNQEYMRMSGRRMVIVLFMYMGFPWEMAEIHVPYDPAFAGAIRDKYLAVRQAAADQRDLGCCGLKGCPAYGLCRVDMAKAEILARTAAPRLAL